MAQKQQRSNRQARKPKQKKSPAAALRSSFPAAHSNPARSIALRRK